MPCPVCSKPLDEGLTICADCEKNPQIVAAYAGAGVAQLERSLANHAAFDEWLEAHEANKEDG